MTLVCPSLRAADLARLGEQLESIRKAGARMIHLDVSDGHFRPEVGFGVPVVESIRKATDLTLDVHLLVERPDRFITDFVSAGADRIAVHPETTHDLYRSLRLIRKQGAIAGVALSPATPLESVSDLLADLDFLNVLSADPGEAEEDYIPYAASKLKAAAGLRASRGAQLSLQVEGAIGRERIDELIEAGANIIVVGAASFSRQDSAAGPGEGTHRSPEGAKGV